MPLSFARADYAASEQAGGELSMADRMALARQFVLRVGKGLKAVDTQTGKIGTKSGVTLPDGELLVLRMQLDKKLAMSLPVTAISHKGDILISLLDFTGSLDFPIDIDPEQGTAQGWYIREQKTFTLDMKTHTVQTDNGTFKISENVKNEDGDIMVPSQELEQWFGFSLDIDVSSQNMLLTSPVPLPVQEKLARGNRQFRNNRVGPPELPLLPEEHKAFDLPFVDVTTRSSFSRPGKGGDNRSRHNASVRTQGDLAYGTLSTQSQLDYEDRLTNVRVNYKRESLEPELLGRLHARRFELGDITTPGQQLDTLPSSGLGMRVTNIHPLRTTLRPSTEITGTAFPGWDVELYRNNQLINNLTVGDDGLYIFKDVDLYASDNNFKVVLYGPQGEIREEEIQIPVDNRRLSETGSVYDISLMAQQTQTYRNRDVQDEDLGAPALSAIYETPVGERSALTAGLETGKKNGESMATAHAGASTVLGGTLLNFDTAVDNNSEMAAKLVARRDLGNHQLRNETVVSTDRFNLENEDGTTNVFEQRLNLDGPFFMEIGRNTRYNLGVGYDMDSEGETENIYRASLNTNLKHIAFNQGLEYSRYSGGQEDALRSITSLSGRIGANRLRMIADYEIKPDSQLERILVTARRPITKKLNAEVGVERMVQEKLTEGRAQLNWDAGFAHISPGVTYNTDNDLSATLTTRFGLARDPNENSVRSFDRALSGTGAVSAYVFLDKNGNNVFDGEDEPLPDVVIKTPQNGSREKTDETGYAFVSRLRPLKATDVYVDEETLKDPFWVSGFRGVSVLPREGHVTPLIFPVHMAGEMDGTLYARDADGNNRSLRGVDVGLYAMDGRKVMGAVSETDGFYLFSKIPPGDYYLLADEEKLPEGVSRPLPKKVHVGFEGTMIYANNIYFQDGRPDVPLQLLADAAVYGEAAERYVGRTFLLNLGKYKSRLSMGLAWFKMRALGRNLFDDVDLLQKPSESVPVDEKGNYILRASVRSNDLNEVYKKCATIAAHGNFCGLEVLPGGLEQPRVAAN
ncbi:MAG TPA: hypothetical protein VFS88_01270 [Micavibrio sp.]|nr:hypothetical protein [Micavibrio sp.]